MPYSSNKMNKAIKTKVKVIDAIKLHNYNSNFEGMVIKMQFIDPLPESNVGEIIWGYCIEPETPLPPGEYTFDAIESKGSSSASILVSSYGLWDVEYSLPSEINKVWRLTAEKYIEKVDSGTPLTGNTDWRTREWKLHHNKFQDLVVYQYISRFKDFDEYNYDEKIDRYMPEPQIFVMLMVALLWIIIKMLIRVSPNSHHITSD